MKTANEILTDMYLLLRDTDVVAAIDGQLYRGGTRPKDSCAEDLVVMFTTADAEQVQKGVVTLNLFVPFITWGDGAMMENIARCEFLEGYMADSIVSLTTARSDYKFHLKEAVHSQRDEELKQSFIVARLEFSYFGEGH